MSVASMTGFARADGAADGVRWSWEVKSVNARNLELRVRVPPGFDEIEARARALAPLHLRRGAVSATLTVAHADAAAALRVNRELLAGLLALVRELRGEIDSAPVQVESLLAVRGVVESAENAVDAEQRERLVESCLASFEATLGSLAEARRAEGAHLAQAIAAHLDEIAALNAAVAGAAAAQPEALKARLAEQIAALTQGAAPVSEDRLAQEVAILVTRADVREELDRLAAHVAAARALLDEGGAVGRRLDFLCQELNREANTVCAKSAMLEITRIGLDLKAAVERLREQVQNLE